MNALYREFGWKHPFEAFDPESSSKLRIEHMGKFSEREMDRFAVKQKDVFKGLDRILTDLEKKNEREIGKLARSRASAEIDKTHLNITRETLLVPNGLARVNQMYREIGWKHLFEAFDPESSLELRAAFIESLDAGDEKRFQMRHDALVNEYRRAYAVEDKLMNLLASRADEMNAIQDGWILGRKYSGLDQVQEKHLKVMADLVQNDLFHQIAEGFRNVAIRHGHARGNAMSEKERDIYDHCGPAIHMWVRDQCHTYFISETLMESLEDTEIGGDFSLTEIPWPMEAFAVVLPKQVLTRFDYPDGKTANRNLIAFILGLPKGDEVQHGITTIYKRFKWEDPKVPARTVISGVPTITLICDGTCGNVINADMLDGPTKSFIFAILFAAITKPELVTRGQRISAPPSGKPSKHRTLPVWTPNYLGRGYQIPDRSSEGPAGEDGRKVRRKRKGHMKMQAHGPQRSLRKRIWVEAYWAGSLEL